MSYAEAQSVMQHSSNATAGKNDAQVHRGKIGSVLNLALPCLHVCGADQGVCLCVCGGGGERGEIALSLYNVAERLLLS